jgi:Spy/CpxP family protein refolding chaperone
MLRKLPMLFILCALGAPIAHGQPGVRDEVKEKVRALRIARLIEALDLDEAGTARFMPIVNRTYDQIGDLAKDSGQARRELRDLIGVEPPDETRINQLIDRLLANRQKIEALELQLIVDARKVLSPAQVARLVVWLPEINHQIQQQIRNAVHPGGPGRPGMPGQRPYAPGPSSGDDPF